MGIAKFSQSKTEKHGCACGSGRWSSECCEHCACQSGKRAKECCFPQ